MKTLIKLLKSYKTWSLSITATGITLTGFGLYDLAKNNMEKADLKIKLGIIMFFSGAAYYSAKRANEKNYSTKPEDYQNKQ